MTQDSKQVMTYVHDAGWRSSLYKKHKITMMTMTMTTMMMTMMLMPSDGEIFYNVSSDKPRHLFSVCQEDAVTCNVLCISGWTMLAEWCMKFQQLLPGGDATGCWTVTSQTVDKPVKNWPRGNAVSSYSKTSNRCSLHNYETCFMKISRSFFDFFFLFF